jgi:hypothetical protein
MRRTDPYDLIPCEREELDRMLNTLVTVKECIRSFEDGEISLRDAVWQMAAVLSAGLTTPLSGEVGD